MDIDVPAGERPCWIYGLYDPETGELRYIGKSIHPEQRLREHIWESKASTARCYRKDWIRSLIARNVSPRFKILAETTVANSAALEIKFIADSRAAGSRLVNLTDGGEGAPGCRPSVETRGKISAALVGRTHTEEHTEKVRAALAGRKPSPQTIESVRTAHLGVKQTPEHIEKKRIALLGRNHTPESIEKMRVAKTGFRHTPETVDKMRALRSTPEAVEKVRSQRIGTKHSPETIAKLCVSQRARQERERLRKNTAA